MDVVSRPEARPLMLAVLAMLLLGTGPPGAGRDEGGGRGLPPHRVVLGRAGWCYRDQPRSLRIPCVDWLAWASIAVPAWTRIWLLENLVISEAMSVSRIREFAAVVFSIA